jgi:hypothetical protein
MSVVALLCFAQRTLPFRSCTARTTTVDARLLLAGRTAATRLLEAKAELRSIVAFILLLLYE